MAYCSGVETNIISCEGGGDAGIWSMLALVINIFSAGVGVLAVIGIVLVGIQYNTAAGDIAKTTKAKRRLFEIIIGIAAYLILWALSQWLIPGGVFHTFDDIQSISISIPNSSIYVGETTRATVKVLPESANNKSFTLISNNKGIATVSSNKIRCVSTGNATITAMAVDGKTSTANISCREKPKDTPKTNYNDDDDSDNNGGYTGSKNSSNCPGDKNLANNDFNTIEDYCLTQSEVNSYVFSHDPTYEEVVDMLKKIGIKEGSEKFTIALSWVNGEGYWDIDNYLAYLCASVILNDFDIHKYDTLDKIFDWGPFYRSPKIDEHVAAFKKDEGSIKSLYLAIKYRQTGYHYCRGNPDLSVPKGSLYSRLITNANGTNNIYIAP